MICEQCGKVFNRTITKRGLQHTHQKFCTSKCAQTYNFKITQIIPEIRIKRLLAMAKSRAKEKNLSFNLTIEYLLFLYNEQNSCCVKTGRSFVLETYGNGHPHPDAPSLDRIKPELGYIEGNVRFLCYHLNVALSNYGEQEFERLIQDYLNTKLGVC